MRNILNCITIGDENGIGLELIYKKKTGTFFILGNFYNISNISKKLNYSLKFKKINKPNEAKKYFLKYLPVLNLTSKSKNHNSLDALTISNKLAQKKLITGIITLPINKNKIILIKKTFIDQTQYYGDLNKKETHMILYSKKIIVSPLTTHIPIIKIKDYINKEFITKKIYAILNSLKKDFNFNNTKIAISGLNPHSGESGKIGFEEIKILQPIIKEFKKRGIMIDGPISADSIFMNYNIKKYDCIITIYHDQALIPFKILNFNDGVNFTSGLDIIRTSPCHGTAYNIVGKKIAGEKSLYNAILLANIIYKNRYNDKKILKSKFSN